MNRWRAVAGATAIAGLAAALLAASPAGAQEEPTTSVPTTETTMPTTTTSSTVPDTTTSSTTPPTTEPQEPKELPLSVNPSTVHPGETSTISGKDCLNDGDPGVLVVVAFDSNDLENPVVEGEADVAADGSWFVTFTAEPQDAGHQFIVAAACFDNEEDANLIAEYGPATITVVGTPSTGPVTPPVLGAVAPVAVAVSAEPTFTG